MLFIVRGLPGSGKSTLGALLPVNHVFEADQYFEKLGFFEPSLLPSAHQQCLEKTRDALQKMESVAVCNTFTEQWEIQPYINLCKELNVVLFIIGLYDGGHTDETLSTRTIHRVPMETIRKMRTRYAHEIRR